MRSWASRPAARCTTSLCMAAMMDDLHTETRDAFWTPWQGPGLEHLRLSVMSDSVMADGLVIGMDEGKAFRFRYLVFCDADWRVTWVTLKLLEGDNRETDLSTDGNGNWFDGMGLPLKELEGCIDVDITVTPFTNTL